MIHLQRCVLEGIRYNNMQRIGARLPGGGPHSADIQLYTSLVGIKQSELKARSITRIFIKLDFIRRNLVINRRISGRGKRRRLGTKLPD